MFGVEALRDSREYAGAHFTSDHEATTDGRQETLLASFGPFADLLDQYASVCNEIISFFAYTVLRLFEAMNNIGSPMELFTNFCIFILTVLFSVSRFLIYEAVCLITLPFRVLLNLLIAHPALLTIIALLSILICTTLIIIIKQISIVKVCNATIRLIAPYCCRFAHLLLLYLCPQYYLLVNILHLLLSPVKLLWDMLVSIILLLPAPRSRRLRRNSLDCGSEDVSRIMCCICFINEKSILLQPCNHICVCADCVEELLETYEEPLCPLCRSVISSYADVYI